MRNLRSCLVGGAGLLAGAASMPAGASAFDVMPHRAIYDLDLASAPSGSPVIDVDGHMYFEWGDSCDGWTIEQRYLMHFFYSQGEEIELTSTYSTWESKDGTEFSFNLRSETNGEVDEEIRGSAAFRGEGLAGAADFRVPEEKSDPLPAGTLFPTIHTLELLKQAEAGNHLFNATLFDGTEVDGLTEVSVAIGDRVPAPEDPSNPLLDRPSWPVSMAFFSEDAPEGLPDYEMSAQLYDNGVAGEMIIDYGDFAVEATLHELEPLEEGGC